MIPNRVKLLQRARKEQNMEQEARDGHVLPYFAAASASTSLRGAPTETCSSPVQEHILQAEVPATLQHPRVSEAEAEDEDREFRLDLAVDLKAFNKRRLEDSSPGTPSSPEDGPESTPMITKVVIALESMTEYRISVSGERPKKRPRNQRNTGT
ncbi:hypothetical protein AN958_11896 [Leucoagaricus sp. SymC.cos]|nr:hypothetical protein AN958_11896 [Leucoagaricus sp. SymC.cos]